MVTLMKKDSLINSISQILELIFTQINSRNEDSELLAALQNKLYGLDHEEIDYEKTFRNAEVPIKTLSELKVLDYKTMATVIVTNKEVAWQSKIDRYENDLKNGFMLEKVPYFF